MPKNPRSNAPTYTETKVREKRPFWGNKCEKPERSSSHWVVELIGIRAPFGFDGERGFGKRQEWLWPRGTHGVENEAARLVISASQNFGRGPVT